MSKQILEGVKVLDLSAVVAGPEGASLLGDFGADVIKIEPPKGDAMRNSGAYNRVLNRNKRCITMDFHNPDAVEQFYRLCSWADVIITNFRPNALQKFHIDYEDVVQYNPQIIYMSFTAYGRTGPYKDRPGFARLAEAYTSLPYMTGWPDRAPSMSGSWITDGIGGVYMAWLITMALLHKEKTGEGQLIDLGLYEPLFRILDDVPVRYCEGKTDRKRMGNRHQTQVPNSVYETKDGKYVAMPVNFSMWSRLCKAMNREDLIDDPRSNTLAARRENADFIYGLIEEFVKEKDRDEIMDLMLKYEVACGPVNSTEDIMVDPHLWERGSLINVTDETGKELTINGVCGVFSKTPGEFKFLEPAIGAQNEEIYKGLLGLSEEQYQALKDNGAI